MMPNTNKTKKKMPWSAVIRRPGFILPRSASKQDADASQANTRASKVNNSPTIPSKSTIRPKSVGTSSTREIPHSTIVIHKHPPSSKQDTQTKDGYVAIDGFATISTMHAKAPSILQTGVHSPFAGVQSTIGSEHAVSRGKERLSTSESTVSESNGSSLGGSFRLATALQERTNHVLDRKAPTIQKHVHCEGDLLPFSELSITANNNAETKVKIKPDKVVAVKDHPQDQPSAHPSHSFPTLYSYGKKVTMIDPNLMIFVIDMVSPETCNVILSCTSRHVRYMTATGNADKCWRSLYTYTKMDIPCAEVPGLGDIMQRVMLGVVAIIGEM
jgi:hypothetical protein